MEFIQWKRKTRRIEISEICFILDSCLNLLYLFINICTRIGHRTSKYIGETINFIIMWKSMQMREFLVLWNKDWKCVWNWGNKREWPFDEIEIDYRLSSIDCKTDRKCRCKRPWMESTQVCGRKLSYLRIKVNKVKIQTNWNEKLFPFSWFFIEILANMR